jgi:hypothetical protein
LDCAVAAGASRNSCFSMRAGTQMAGFFDNGSVSALRCNADAIFAI